MPRTIVKGALGTSNLADSSTYYLFVVKPIEKNFQHGNSSTTIETEKQIQVAGSGFSVLVLDEKPWFPTWQVFRNNLVSIFYSDNEEFPGFRNVLLQQENKTTVCWVKQSTLVTLFNFQPEDLVPCSKDWNIKGAERFPATSQPLNDFDQVLQLINLWNTGEITEGDFFHKISLAITPHNLNSIYKSLPEELKENFLDYAKGQSENELFIFPTLTHQDVQRIDLCNIFKTWVCHSLSSQENQP